MCRAHTHLELFMEEVVYDLDWGSFSLIEFLVSSSGEIGNKFKNCIDIGSGAGVQTDVLRHAGLEVFQVDKYSDIAEYKVDFIEHQFDQKFDIVLCSHVIEHQRNVGQFLDKIYDLMSDSGVLIISAPKHSAETMIEGHLNCFITPFLVQHLVHAGFDLKNGKYLSCAGIENSAIVSKAENFCISERTEAGHTWTEKHQARSFLLLQNQIVKNEVPFFHNCLVVNSDRENEINLAIPHDYKKSGIILRSNRWNLEVSI